jgi:alkylation response protein AidB-like acyl-CoA dehydrogenase
MADADEIDRVGEIPDDVMKALAEIGAFGIKIPQRFGGLGLSQTNYSRAAMRLGAHCGNLTALLSAHQSIGVPQPLLMFGTPQQKEKYLPRCAKGEITAFALTEPEVGSDPARMRTTATPTADGKGFHINGEKLWCTNGTRAGLLVVMARTPVADSEKGTAKAPITAFIVEANAPGVEIVHRCRFMGLRALYNAVIRFTDVYVPRENIILGEGKGLRVALSTLNIGRITLPAACAGAAKRCVAISVNWSRRREQWGARIGDHAAISAKLAKMSAQAFGIESLVYYVSALVGKKADVRLEAALAKLWGTERAWDIIHETMQIRGGRGYETADSLRARGEIPEPVERFLRDARINTIFEGSSEIMRLFIAREALDPHLQAGAPLLDTRLPIRQRLRAIPGILKFYLPHLTSLVWPWRRMPDAGPFKSEIRQVARHSRRLARTLLLCLARFGPKLEKQQLVLGRLVDAGAELLVATAAISYGAHLRKSSENSEIEPTVRHLCELASARVDELLTQVVQPTDRSGYQLAQLLLAKKAPDILTSP